MYEAGTLLLLDSADAKVPGSLVEVKEYADPTLCIVTPLECKDNRWHTVMGLGFDFTEHRENPTVPPTWGWFNDEPHYSPVVGVLPNREAYDSYLSLHQQRLDGIAAIEEIYRSEVAKLFVKPEGETEAQ